MFSWVFPWKQAGYCVFSVILYFLSKRLAENSKRYFYPSILCLAIITGISLIIKFISVKAGASVTLPQRTNLPDTVWEGICCVLIFIFGAVYEEIIYRFYFTDALKRLLAYLKIPDNRLMFFVTEAAGLLVFSFGHLYMGILAVINAAFAHCVFRLLYKKTGLIWNCVIIHFVYNVISLILL